MFNSAFKHCSRLSPINTTIHLICTGMINLTVPSLTQYLYFLLHRLYFDFIIYYIYYLYKDFRFNISLSCKLIMVNLHLVLFPSWNISFQKILFNFSNTIYLGFFLSVYTKRDLKRFQMVLYKFISKVEFNLIKMLTTCSPVYL